MKIVEAFGKRFERSFQAQIAALLIVSMLFWAVGVPTLVKQAHAAYLSQVSDILSDSGTGALSQHIISWTSSTSTFQNESLVIQLDPVTSDFVESFTAATTSNIKGDTANFVVVADFAACLNPTDVYPTGNYNNGTNENLTLTVCPGATLAPATFTLGIGSSTMIYRNASTTGSYRIPISGPRGISGETRVAILPHVTLTATVDSTFTFTVGAVPAGVVVNSTLTTDASTATTIPFGTMTPGPGGAKIIGQQLNVTSNATNGFQVTVVEDQPPTSGSGAKIYLFKDGSTSTTPIVWTTPRGILNANQTYAHLGVTSSDSDEGCVVQIPGCTGEFVPTTTTPYIGNIITPRVLFAHYGPADGVTASAGSTTVAYKLETTTLLPAGDYTNQLIYVATPTF